MFRKLEELLENGSLDKEIAEAIDIEITKAHKGLKDERDSLTSKNKDLSASFDEVSKSKEELDSQLSDLDSKIIQAKEDGKGELATQLKLEREAKEALQKSLNGLQKANTGLKLDRAVTEALKGFDIMDAHKDTTEFMLRSRVSVNDKGDTVYSDGGNTSTIEDGFKGYFDINQGKIKPIGDGGGSGAKDGQSNVSQSVKSRADFDKMNDGAKNKFMLDGGTVN